MRSHRSARATKGVGLSASCPPGPHPSTLLVAYSRTRILRHDKSDLHIPSQLAQLVIPIKHPSTRLKHLRLRLPRGGQRHPLLLTLLRPQPIHLDQPKLDERIKHPLIPRLKVRGFDQPLPRFLAGSPGLSSSDARGDERVSSGERSETFPVFQSAGHGVDQDEGVEQVWMSVCRLDPDSRDKDRQPLPEEPAPEDPKADSQTVPSDRMPNPDHFPTTQPLLTRWSEIQPFRNTRRVHLVRSGW